MAVRATIVLALALVACGRPRGWGGEGVRDSQPFDGDFICNPLIQAGCSSGEKCTWIIDSGDPKFAGHVGCAPNGTMQTGQACTRNPPGPDTGYDDCAEGNYCFGPTAGGAGVCKLICDEVGGAPMCPTKYGCVAYLEIFQEGDNPALAGVCEPTCDPLNDNNFLGSAGTKTGSACSATSGCTGLPPDFSTTQPTVFTCSPIVNPTRIHRSACTGMKQPGDGSACLDRGRYIYPSSCSPGYQPLITDYEGSMQQDCVAMCAAQDCYNAGSGLCPGSAFAGGSSGGVSHTCYDGSASTPRDIAVDPATTSYLAPSATGGDVCNYLWNLEFDASGMFVRSATSDTIGLCIHRELYYYDSNGDGMINTGTDIPWPACGTITSLHSGSNGSAAGCPTPKYPAGTVCCVENGCLGADGTPNLTVYGPFACVSATSGGAFGGKTRPLHRFPMLRLPYRR
jgi:hypothetical protein